MKKELIKTDNYLIIVDDLEIKVGDWVIETRNGLNELHFTNSRYVIDKHIQKKVIAHVPLGNSPILEGVPLLPPLEVEDDVEMMAEEEYPIIPYTSPNVNWDRANKQEGFEEGYNKAREKCKFTEQDMITFGIRITSEAFSIVNGKGSINMQKFDEILKSLSQPKMPTHFEFEMEWCNSYESPTLQYDAQELKNKTTINSQGQEVACGKYIYEL